MAKRYKRHSPTEKGKTLEIKESGRVIYKNMLSVKKTAKSFERFAANSSTIDNVRKIPGKITNGFFFINVLFYTTY